MHSFSMLMVLLGALNTVSPPAIVTSEDTFFERSAAGTLPDRATWVAEQTPLVDAPTLAELLLTQREVIETLTASWSHNVDAIDGLEPGQVDVQFAMNDIALRRSQTNQDGATTTSGYDGTVQRTLLTTERHGSGEISLFKGRMSFFKPDDPLSAAMLVDSTRDLQVPWAAYDLVEFLQSPAAVVLGDVVEVNGRECIVAVFGLPAQFRIFLDLERDFALVRFEEWQYSVAADGTRTRALLNERDCSDHIDLGHGVWLPSRIETNRFGSRLDSHPIGSTVWTRVTTVSNAAMNAPLAPDALAVTFDEGVMVFDDITKARYREGEDRSIESAIVAALPTPAIPGSGTSPSASIEWQPKRDIGVGLILLAVVSSVLLWWKSRQTHVA